MVDELTGDGGTDGSDRAIETVGLGGPGADSLGLGRVFDLLAQRDSRFVLYCLWERRESISVSTLAEHVALLTEETQSSSPRVEDIHIRLHHATLPKLSDAGLAVHDPDQAVVEPTPSIDALSPFIERTLSLEFNIDAPVLENCGV